jgi:hypothetical protein
LREAAWLEYERTLAARQELSHNIDELIHEWQRLQLAQANAEFTLKLAESDLKHEHFLQQEAAREAAEAEQCGGRRRQRRSSV